MPDGQGTFQLTLADASCAELQDMRHPALVPHTSVVHRRLWVTESSRRHGIRTTFRDASALGNDVARNAVTVRRFRHRQGK